MSLFANAPTLLGAHAGSAGRFVWAVDPTFFNRKEYLDLKPVIAALGSGNTLVALSKPFNIPGELSKVEAGRDQHRRRLASGANQYPQCSSQRLSSRRVLFW